MRANLFRLGTDFGNGPADRAYFQRDEHTAAALSEKRRIMAAHPERFGLFEEHVPKLAAVLQWMRTRAVQDVGPSHGDGSNPCIDDVGRPNARVPQTLDELAAACNTLASQVAEDFVIMTRNGDEHCASLVHVCFPSGWHPERILGLGFDAIHEPVADFEPVAKRSASLVRALFERGPYVRFVWTLCPDAQLDRHPSRELAPWSETSGGCLRVERQVTVPFPALDASLFLIRVHLYPFSALNEEQRGRVCRSLQQTSEAILSYKGLLDDRAVISTRLCQVASAYDSAQ